MLAKARKVAFWGIVVFSIISLVFSPFGKLKDEAIGSVWWLVGGALVTEILFILGLVIIAIAMGRKIGNPIKLRKQWKQLLSAGFRSNLFWVGFWVNLVGSVGTTVVFGVGILTVLPIQSWGLTIIPAADLTATIVIRKAVIKRRNSRPVSPGE